MSAIILDKTGKAGDVFCLECYTGALPSQEPSEFTK